MLLVNTSYYAILHMTHTWARHKQVSRNRHWCQRSKDVRWSRSWTARFSSSAGVQNIHVSTLCAWEGTNTSELKAPYKRRHASTFRCIMQGEGWGLFSQKPLSNPHLTCLPGKHVDRRNTTRWCSRPSRTRNLRHLGEDRGWWWRWLALKV